MNYFEITYTVIGGLGLFFLGLKFLSEALQSGGKEAIRKILAQLTKNRIYAVLAGIGITAFVQSSSISTVMTVSLVNAGLMQLEQAIGVILGANIGTTITGWIISIKVGKYGLLFIGLGIFPMMVAKNRFFSSLGKTCVALGLIFVGLQFMGDAFRPLRTDPAFINYLTIFDAQSLCSLIACVIMGCVLTCIVQSSSAMLGITITLAMTGVINFDTAVGLIIGENIGTTITAQLASIGANSAAVRTARAHAIFNIIGAMFMVLIFPFYTTFVDAVVPGEVNFIDDSGDRPYIAIHIALAHTLFNVVNVLIWIPFISHLSRLVTWLVPHKGEKETPKLKYLGNPSSTGVTEVSLQQAHLELKNMLEITSEMLDLNKEYLQCDEHDEQLYERISHLESITDNIEEEMITFITAVLASPTSREQSSRAYGLIRMTDEVESIADCIQSVSIYRRRLFEKNEIISPQGWDDLLGFYDEITAYFHRIVEARNSMQVRAKLRAIVGESAELNAHANEVRTRHLDRIRDGSCQSIPALTYSDMAVSMRRIKNHSINFLEAYAGVPLD